MSRSIRQSLTLGGGDLFLSGPGRDVSPLDGGGHQVREFVGRAGEGGYAQRGKGAGDVSVESRGAAVAEREKGDHLHAAGRQRGGALDHLFSVSALVQITDQNQNGVLRVLYKLLAIGESAID